MAKRSKTSAVFPAVATKLVPDLNSRSNQNEFMKELGKTMDFNQEILQSSGLFFRPSVPESLISDLCGKPDHVFLEAMKETDAEFNETVFGKNPLYLRMTLAARHYLKEKNTKMLDAVMFYTAFKVYSMIYVKYFTVGSAKTEVMEYTILHLSNKFDLRKYKTLQAVLSKIAEGNLDNYRDRLLSNDDEDIFAYIEGLRTRINSFVKNIMSEFDDNYKNKRYMNVQQTSATNAEGEDFDIERENATVVIARASQNFSIKFASTPINEHGLRMAKQYESAVSEANVRTVLNYLRNDKKNRAEVIASGVFGLLLDTTGGKDIGVVCNGKFVPLILSLFNKTNVTDTNIVKVKKNLEDVVSEVYPNAKGSTLLRTRKACLAYLAWELQRYNCHSS